MEKKITKIEVLGIIKEAMADNEVVVAYCDNEIAHLEAKAVKAKERAAIKKLEGNEFYRAVVDLVGSELMTRDAVFAAYGDDDGEITVGKIQAALNWGSNQGLLEKEKVKVDGKDKTCYRKAE